MTVGIVGSRQFSSESNFRLLDRIIRKKIIDLKEIDEIVSGGAKGADTLGEKFAFKYKIKIKIFNADWNSFGKSAGFIRNNKIVSYVKNKNGIIFAFWDGLSSGTEHTINLCKVYKCNMYVIRYKSSTITKVIFK